MIALISTPLMYMSLAFMQSLLRLPIPICSVYDDCEWPHYRIWWTWCMFMGLQITSICSLNNQCWWHGNIYWSAKHRLWVSVWSNVGGRVWPHIYGLWITACGLCLSQSSYVTVSVRTLIDMPTSHRQWACVCQIQQWYVYQSQRVCLCLSDPTMICLLVTHSGSVKPEPTFMGLCIMLWSWYSQSPHFWTWGLHNIYHIIAACASLTSYANLHVIQ